MSTLHSFCRVAALLLPAAFSHAGAAAETARSRKIPRGACAGSDTLKPLPSVTDAVDAAYPFIDAAVPNTAKGRPSLNVAYLQLSEITPEPTAITASAWRVSS